LPPRVVKHVPDHKRREIGFNAAPIVVGGRDLVGVLVAQSKRISAQIHASDDGPSGVTADDDADIAVVNGSAVDDESLKRCGGRGVDAVVAGLNVDGGAVRFGLTAAGTFRHEVREGNVLVVAGLQVDV